MLSYLLEVTFCWAGFYGLYALLLSRTTFFQTNRWYLFGTMLLGILVPLVPLPQWSPQAASVAYYLEPIKVGVHQVELSVQAMPSHNTFSLSFLLLCVYVGGLALSGTRLGIGLWKLWSLFRESKRERREGFTMVYTQGRHLPFSFFNLMFWSGNLQLEEEEWTSIMRHEKAHIRGLHSLDVLFTELLCVAFWCVPFVYLYRRSLRQVHEYLADRAALTNMQPRRYGHMLLRQSQNDLQLAFANHLLQSPLKKRITMMTRHQTARSAMLRYALLLPLLVLFLLVFANRNLIGQTLLEIHKADGTVEKHQVDPQNMPEGLLDPNTIESMDVKGNPSHILVKLKAMPDTLPNPEAKPSVKADPKASSRVIIRAQPHVNMNENTNVNENLNIDIRKSPPSGVTISDNGAVIKADPRIIIYQPDGTFKDHGNDSRVLKGIDPNTIQSVNVIKSEEEPDGVIEIRLKEASQTTQTRASENTMKFSQVEEMPVFAGCAGSDMDSDQRNACTKEKLVNYLISELKYPLEARKAGVEGKVLVAFTIGENGEIIAPNVVQSLDPHCDTEALRVIKAMPAWTPGQQKGKAVAVKMTLPFNFALPTEKLMNGGGSKSTELKLKDFHVSPNPSAGNVRLQFHGEALPTQLRISDLQGRTLISRDMEDFDGIYDQQLDLKSFESGTLFLSISQGDKIFTRRIVLQ